MKAFIYESKKFFTNEMPFEVVETKGKGHPDNICDTLAEKISAQYSKYCLEKYGVILRHMIDKLSILGGGSKVSFGMGKMVSPIRVLINGRFTNKFGTEIIDYMSIVVDTVKSYFRELFPLLDVDEFLKIIDNTHHNEGPGVVYDVDGNTKNERKAFFEVLDDVDLSRHNNHFRCNDTSTTVSYFPMSNLECLVLQIEQELNSDSFKSTYPWVGNDIKVMGIRKNNEVEITSCIPLIAKYVEDLDDYKIKMEKLKEIVTCISKHFFPNNGISVYLNTRDNYEKNDLYLTAIGSAVESGDEGAVGRGNRSRGVIPFSRNFSMEASCGKNPVYHTGKLFAAIGDTISERIYKELDIENTVFCTSKMGDLIENPWSVAVEINATKTNDIENAVEKIVREEIDNHYLTSLKLINHTKLLNSY